jgi:hypothetical protein
MKTVKELQEYVDKNKATLRLKELQEYVEKHLVKVPDPDDREGWLKLSFENDLTYRNFTDKEFEEHIKKTIQGIYDFNSSLIEMGIINILQHEGYPLKLRTIAAEQYRADTLSLLEQIIESRDWGIDFFSFLSAYKPLFEEMVLNWWKRKIVHLLNRINDEPTDEIYQTVIKDKFRAENELLINSNNPILPFYHDRLTSLIDNLDKRYAIAGGFESKSDNREPIIEKERLALIFRKYKDCFNEPEDTWIKRFVYSKEAPVNPLELDPKAIEGSNKLILLAILSSIQDKRKDSFDYNDFVSDRFGIKNFDKARFDHKEKLSFKKTFTECNDILMK